MEGHNQGVEVRRGPGRDGADPQRAAHWGTQRSLGRRPRSPHPIEANGTLGGWHLAEWAGNLGCLEDNLDLRPICLASLIKTIWLFGLLSNGPNGPLPGRLPGDPLCLGWAGTDRPLGRASPVTGAQKLRASRLLVGLPCRGAALGAEVGVR